MPVLTIFNSCQRLDLEHDCNTSGLHNPQVLYQSLTLLLLQPQQGGIQLKVVAAICTTLHDTTSQHTTTELITLQYTIRFIT